MNNNKNDNFLLAQRTSENQKELCANLIVNAMLRLLKYVYMHNVYILYICCSCGFLSLEIQPHIVRKQSRFSNV